MSQQELLKLVVGVLERLQVPYMITGSLASTFHGEPRATHDVDLVVLLRPEQVSTLVSEFQAPDFYLDDDAAKAAIRERSMFNLLDIVGGDKVDFWLLTDEPFDTERFRRRQREDLGGFEAYIATAEDTILAKLRWAKLAGGSEKQLGDAASVFSLNEKTLDQDYLKSWVEKLNVRAEWKALLSKLGR